MKKKASPCDCGAHAWLPLTKGYVTMIDPEDVEKIDQAAYVAFSRSKPYARMAKGEYVHQRVTGVRGLFIDHINHDTLDNRKINLRKCTSSQNLMNMRPHEGKSCVFKGVSAYRGRWRASIKIPGPKYTTRLGAYDTPEEAAEAYDAAAIKHFGEFAFTNKAAGLLC